MCIIIGGLWKGRVQRQQISLYHDDINIYDVQTSPNLYYYEISVKNKKWT